MFTRVSSPLLFGLIGSLVVATAACAKGHRLIGSSMFDDDSGSPPGPPPTGTGDGSVDDDATAPISVPDGSGGGCDACSDVAPGFCGDGLIQPGEQCDDANMVSGDGCSVTCQIEPGFVCPTPGQPCMTIAKCGDGKVESGEQCDDGNTTPGDGCSATCQIEPGFACGPSTGSGADGGVDGGAAATDGGADAGAPPGASSCHRTVCGDGVKEGSEQCDDGNLIPYDGCSPTCTIEPKCNGAGGCTGACGDGLVFPGEECDDGNTASGDGCSSTCQIETGYVCTNTAQPPAATLVIPILYRDMLYWDTTNFPTPRPPGGGHPDFNHFNPGRVPGLVQPTLGADSEPVFASTGDAGQVLSTATNFCWWYHETGCGDAGANPYDKLVYLDSAGKPTTLTLTQGASGTYVYAQPLFYPLDGLGWNAGTNPQTASDCEPNPADGGVLPPRGPHNFSFTSELHYVFTFQASVAATAPALFAFTGDDSVWAFINNQLVVDLGGVHDPLGGSLSLTPANAAALGLIDGGWYSIDVFQAEQHVCRSTYALTLSGFVHIVSQCQSVCGDGVVAGKEQCDNGPSNVPTALAYGSGVCTTDCTLAPSCGDGVVEVQFGEQCDDGTNLATYGGTGSQASKVCGPGCRWAPYCGDGIVQSQFGEQCDSTSGCNSMCQKPM
jgi:fibro-slime domain-containing protein